MCLMVVDDQRMFHVHFFVDLLGSGKAAASPATERPEWQPSRHLGKPPDGSHGPCSQCSQVTKTCFRPTEAEEWMEWSSNDWHMAHMTPYLKEKLKTTIEGKGYKFITFSKVWHPNAESTKKMRAWFVPQPLVNKIPLRLASAKPSGSRQ